MAPELMVTSLFHTNGKSSCFTQDVRLIALQSSNQDSSVEGEQEEKEYGSFSSRLSIRLENPDAEKPTDDPSIRTKVHHHSEWKNYSGRRLLGQFSPSIGERITILAGKVQCRVPADGICKVFSPKRRPNFISRDSRRLDQHRRLYSKVLGKRSSSSKTPLQVHLLAPANRSAKWKESRKCERWDLC